VLLCAPGGGIVNDPILLKLAEDHFCLARRLDALLYALGVQAFASMDVEIREPGTSAAHSGAAVEAAVRTLFGDDVADQRTTGTSRPSCGIRSTPRERAEAELGYEVYCAIPRR
jgi:aminomethyltransferase